MNTQPEAIEKHWRNEHWLYCAECGEVAFIKSYDLKETRRDFGTAWKQHLEEKHSERKP